MQTLLVWLKKLDHAVSVTTRTICIVALAAIFVMFLLNVFVRFVPVYNFTQTDDWIQLCLVWMIFLGAQELVRTRSHFVVDVLTERMAGTQTGRFVRILVCLIECVTYAVLVRDCLGDARAGLHAVHPVASDALGLCRGSGERLFYDGLRDPRPDSFGAKLRARARGHRSTGKRILTKMTRSFWIFEAFLAVAGVLAGLIFHCIFKFYVNPQMQDINWTWMGFITVAMVIAGFPAWLAAKKTSWLRLTVLTNVFNFVLLALVPLWYIAFGSDGMEKTLAWYFSAAWALSGVLPAIFACAAFGTTGRCVFTGGRN